ncbi:lanthionine synthetase C family protein [Flagellimonas onchidii]|uniref:lanthionine synthetase C family protein n=1 Tax=Flagellimonas onchidii TaxID=2562684 RepID=UPI0010A5C395|nr:lanthionine synthetase C family protein [Allomuricauda onchidii]
MHKSLASAKVFEIERVLAELPVKENSFSLFSGIGGLPIFYYLLNQYTRDIKYIEKANLAISEIFEMLNSAHYGVTYCNGLAGVGFMINYIKKTGCFNTLEVDESLCEIDDYIFTYTEDRIKSSEDLDFLHGAFGATYYLLTRVEKNSLLTERTKHLFYMLCNVLNSEIDKSNEVHEVRHIDNSLHKTNCGLAHGHGSYIAILAKALMKFEKEDIIRDTLRNCINCLLSFQSKDENSISCFPAIAISPYTANYEIPMGWCYGDQTASLSLYRGGIALGDKNIINKAIQIALKTLNRDTFIKAQLSPLTDACFCHGSASVAYLNKKWGQITKNSAFNELYQHFVKVTLKKGDNDIGLAGYQKYLGDNKHENAIGLLDGVIGVGVMLLDYLLEDNQLNWDSFFLLD